MNPNDIRCAVALSMGPDLATVKVRCLASIDVTAMATRVEVDAPLATGEGE